MESARSKSTYRLYARGARDRIWIDSGEHELQIPKMYRWTWLGEPVGVDELIYYMFSERHRQAPDPERVYTKEYILADYDSKMQNNPSGFWS